jgi:hypothetical protein
MIKLGKVIDAQRKKDPLCKIWGFDMVAKPEKGRPSFFTLKRNVKDEISWVVCRESDPIKEEEEGDDEGGGKKGNAEGGGKKPKAPKVTLDNLGIILQTPFSESWGPSFALLWIVKWFNTKRGLVPVRPVLVNIKSVSLDPGTALHLVAKWFYHLFTIFSGLRSTIFLPFASRKKC